MKRYIIIFLVLGLAASLPSPVYAVKKDTKLILDELQKLAASIKTLEVKITAISVETTAMSKKIGIIEEKVGALSKSQADNNQDKENLLLSLQFIKEELNQLKNSVSTINDRLVSMPAGTTPAGTESAGDTTAGGVAQSPESIYYTAYSDYIKKNYDLAVEGFKQFIDLYPTNGLADNSLYWIGECYYAQKKYQDAVDVFSQLRNKYEDGDKVPDAILKEGFALIEMGKRTDGIDVLKELVSKFPLSEEASLAQQKIKEVMD
ncbi:MAG: tol-pal system protein YbgF [bacterium]|nr:tol-pal system protein YbgF [bacterium]